MLSKINRRVKKSFKKNGKIYLRKKRNSLKKRTNRRKYLKGGSVLQGEESWATSQPFKKILSKSTKDAHADVNDVRTKDKQKKALIDARNKAFNALKALRPSEKDKWVWDRFNALQYGFKKEGREEIEKDWITVSNNAENYTQWKWEEDAYNTYIQIDPMRWTGDGWTNGVWKEDDN